MKRHFLSFTMLAGLLIGVLSSPLHAQPAFFQGGISGAETDRTLRSDRNVGPREYDPDMVQDYILNFLAAEGGMLLVDCEDPETTDVLVEGERAESLVVDGGLLVFVEEAGDEIATIRSTNPRRMEVEDADEFDPGEAEMIEAVDGEAQFTAGDKPIFVFGFDQPPVACDVTDPENPVFLMAERVRLDDSFAIYIQVPEGTEIAVYEVRTARELQREERLERMEERRTIRREFRAERETLISTLKEDVAAEIDSADYPRHIERLGETGFTDLVADLRDRLTPEEEVPEEPPTEEPEEPETPEPPDEEMEDGEIPPRKLFREARREFQALGGCRTGSSEIYTDARLNSHI